MELCQDDMHATIGGDNYRPALVIRIEIGESVPDIPVCAPASDMRYGHARVIVCLHGCPLGLLSVPMGAAGVSADALARDIWSRFNKEINEHLAADKLPEATKLSISGLAMTSTPACLQERAHFLSSAPAAMVAICTRDRPDQLRQCLVSVLRSRYPEFRVLVVDNAPSSARTEHLVATLAVDDRRLSYVREERPGSYWARNRAIREADTEYIAFTDDDVVVDEHWLGELVRGFEFAKDVAAVSGLTLPARLDSASESQFEELNSFANGFSRLVHNAGSRPLQHPLYPYNTIPLGATNNIAYRTAVLRQIGGFRTDARSGNDIDCYFRVTSLNQTLVYQPNAMVSHFHRGTEESMRRQLRTYGSAFAVFLAKSVFHRPSTLALLFRALPHVVHALMGFRQGRTRTGLSSINVAKERWMGFLQAPVWYARERWAQYQTIRRYGALDLRHKTPRNERR